MLTAEKHVIAKQADFEIRFIWWALWLAILAGFALGAHVASTIGFNFPLGNVFYPYIQTHGHIQLVGWAGLFIIGISLHFFPRLAGVPVANPSRLKITLRLLVSGLALRFLVYSVLPYLEQTALFKPGLWLAVLSGFLEWVGIITYVSVLVATLRAAHVDEKPALKSVRLFFLIAFCGWLLYVSLNLFLLIDGALAEKVILNQTWSEFGLQLFLNLVLIPIVMAFSIRLFPLYLRLPVVDWSVRTFTTIYLCAISLQIVPVLPVIAASGGNLPGLISGAGLVAKGSLILWFVWKLDLLTRRHPPWTVHRDLHPGPERKPTRPGLPDYGEFGRFEWLVYSSYAWLVFGALLETAIGMAVIAGWALPVSSDAVRHVYLLGFVSHLILGMAPRMIPGFIKKKRTALPGSVMVSFWLITIATLTRVVPLLLPPDFLSDHPELATVSQSAFGLSGIFAIAAVITLTINLRKTAKA